MAFQKPTHAYWSLTLIAIPHGMSWVFETFIKTQQWWQSLPLTGLTWIFLAVGFGLILGDCYNKNSWLRHNLKELHKVFEVQACCISQEFEPHEFFGIICLIKFTKNVKEAKLVIRVIDIAHAGNSAHVVHDEKITMLKDSERRLRLGSLPVNSSVGRHAVWGEKLGEVGLLPGQRPIYGTNSVVEVSVNKQTYRAYIKQLPEHITDKRAWVEVLNESDLEAFNKA